ncbi:hypothetical protein PC110_g6271 [Phytophthora cactorum]|uniref:M-phase-specific PLK1-interacting protein n=2 Tax=Phytophthora cactorum TaxID=29920 RepID=A0A329SPJ4_9STRA|nr:hypothetical protein PC110_g6271 [Phytophthora cactorum]
MQPPPPPPPGVGSHGPPPPMPPQLQAMMRQMQQRQPKFQQQTQPPAPYQQHQVGGRRGGRGGRGCGRGRGRGSFQQQNYRQNRGYNNHQSHIKRKRGPSDDVRDASRFFLPSFLKDPWKELEAANGPNAANEMQYVDRQREEMRPRQVQYATNDGPGRVFFQPSFLEDPWAQFVR